MGTNLRPGLENTIKRIVLFPSKATLKANILKKYPWNVQAFSPLYLTAIPFSQASITSGENPATGENDAFIAVPTECAIVGLEAGIFIVS